MEEFGVFTSQKLAKIVSFCFEIQREIEEEIGSAGTGTLSKRAIT